MGSVGLYREYEGIFFVDVEKDHIDLLLTPGQGSSHPMHPIDYSHRWAVNENWRECPAGLNKPAHMHVVSTLRPRPEAATKLDEWHSHDHRIHRTIRSARVGRPHELMNAAGRLSRSRVHVTAIRHAPSFLDRGRVCLPSQGSTPRVWRPRSAMVRTRKVNARRRRREARVEWHARDVVRT